MSKRRLVAAAVLAVTATLGCAVYLASRPTTSIAFDEHPFDVCQSGTPEVPWSRLRVQPTEFGLDVLAVHGPGKVYVVAVEPVGASNARITDVTFIPGGLVGNGFPYGDRNALGHPATWDERRNMPTALDALTPSSPYGDWSRLPVWQAMIGVVGTNPDAPARIQALRYTILVGGRISTLIGRASAAVSPTGDQCFASTTPSTVG